MTPTSMRTNDIINFEKDDRLPVTLRLPKKLVARIDQLRERLPVTIPRNTWIAEAIAMRLEGNGSNPGERNVSK